MFYVGQKVVCIKKGPWHCAVTGHAVPLPLDPVEGRIYTIVDIQLVCANPPVHTPRDGLYLHLDEVPYGTSYHAIYFRPLVKRPTDISVFTKMLNHDPVKTPQGA